MASCGTCLARLVVPALLGLAIAAEAGDADRGAELLLPLKLAMKAALVEGLAEGPAAAIEVCAERAPEISAELSVEGVRMGRSSHRLRNPANAGPGWIEATLARYNAGGERKPELIELDDELLGYVEPIATEPMCLTCHGTTLAEPIAGAISARYPADQATGFEAGDLRGVFWVEFPR